ncbi:hypothetical protein PK35_06450 [Tamlana nanhaiensis]|uniref:NRDE family protein n=1 Tax=Neotamlana nanhaiensis TaxID=1382798 RepID=A0A0D7W6N6_9FLAO|nr:NRDE family protein [Tamlana nanhaiensis]KJD33487.1 hypothetical protein PK35_06450 [Tamlana nanhaiensis]
MCTVSIFPTGNNDFILTSNRDEAPSRISLPPQFYNFEGKQLLYPKDELSDGTWVGISENSRLICLLNGGVKIHKRKKYYRKSRGLVVKELLAMPHVVNVFNDYNFDDIEPFTLVIADWRDDLKLYEFIWDGFEKYFNNLPLQPKIWSSSTLYNDVMKTEREDWFNIYKAHVQLDAESALDFHKTAGKGNLDYGVIMDRGIVKTTSITQVVKQNNVLEMRYENVRNNLVTKETFNFPEIVND